MSTSEGLYTEIIDKIETPSASALLVKLLLKEGKTEIAIEACLKALEIFPDNMTIRRLLAETYLQQGRMELAERELERLADQIGELTSVFKLQAKLFKEEEKLKEAIRALEVYLVHHKDDEEAAQLLSELSSAGKGERDVVPTPTLAEIFFNQGALEEAIKVYQQVVEASPDDEKSKMRLNELKQMKVAEVQEIAGETATKGKKLELIRILENWLGAIESQKVGNLTDFD
ncbi:MAG: tetratricopeptide repeat protein [Deltaproteobacteria bacterium]|nr:MAG: tetratricopeptide repeat protein [Deltaproteobacteria bacterium]UCH08045.1 MAG: tetratricopeptide repeat protein [Deltaproteobacteria bacterium]